MWKTFTTVTLQVFFLEHCNIYSGIPRLFFPMYYPTHRKSISVHSTHFPIPPPVPSHTDGATCTGAPFLLFSAFLGLILLLLYGVIIRIPEVSPHIASLEGTETQPLVGNLFFFQAAPLAASTTRSGTLVPSPTPSPKALKVGTHNYRRVATSGDSGFPSTFSTPALELNEGRVFTRHHCYGAWDPKTRQGNKTCAFTNLYFDGSTTIPQVRHSFVYATLLEDAPRGTTASEWALRVKGEVADIKLAATNREASQWFLEVVVFETSEERDDYPVLSPFPAAPSNLTFMMQRAVPNNIGSVIWEEKIALFSALGDLGFEGRHGDFSPLFLDPVPYPNQQLFWDHTKGIQDAIHPRGTPLMLYKWAESVGPKALTRFPLLAAGAMGRTASGYPGDYSTPGHELGLVWRFRKALIEGFRYQHLDRRDWGTHPLGDAEPLNIMILQKVEKRRFRQPEELRDAIKARYPMANVWVQRWEAEWSAGIVPATLNERIQQAMNATITISASGTDTYLAALMMPRGSVMIEAGAMAETGRTAHIADCFGHAIEHVRMLYYTGHTKAEADGCGCKQDDFFTLNVTKMLPLVDQAVEWVKSGKGSAPIHWPENSSPQGKFTSCLLLKYPRAQWWASYQQGTGGDASMGINADPRNYWLLMARSAVPGTPSKLQIITPREELPPVPSEDLNLPKDFEATLSACALWSKADVLERIGGGVGGNMGAPLPDWVAERIGEHIATRNSRTDICDPRKVWCGKDFPHNIDLL